MNQQPVISIIIPYLDEVDFLSQAIASAIKQHGIEKEIILVCNAASPPSISLPIDPGNIEIKHIHEPRQGSAFARNTGLAAAKGQWVQFLDVDDLLEPEKIVHQLAHDKVDVVVSPHRFLHINGKRENSKWLPDDVWIGLLNSGLGSTSSMLWKREAVMEAGGWNTAIQSHQEYDLLFRIIKIDKRIQTDDHIETLVRQRKSGSITQMSKPVRLIEGIHLRESMWEFIQSRKLDTPERYDAFRQYIFRQLRGLYRQDKRYALELYLKYFTGMPFTPQKIHVPGYKLCYRLFGFNALESILSSLSKLKG